MRPAGFKLQADGTALGRYKKMMFRLAVTVFSAYVFIPSTAYAYVDPGLVSMVIQGLFAAVAAFTAVYVLGQWRWFK